MSNIFLSSKSKPWKNCNLLEFPAECRRNIWLKPFQVRTYSILWQDNIFSAKKSSLCCVRTWKIKLFRWIIFCWIKIQNKYIKCLVFRYNKIKVSQSKWYQKTNFYKEKSNCSFQISLLCLWVLGWCGCRGWTYTMAQFYSWVRTSFLKKFTPTLIFKKWK